MSLLPPGNWAERKTAQLHAEPSEGPWIYAFSCVESDSETVGFIRVHEEEITFEEFIEDIDTTVFEYAMGYTKDDMGLQLEKDWSVSYGKSWLPPDHPEWPSRECRVLTHSGIEYVWIKQR